MAQEVTEVNVEGLAVLVDHNVVRVSVANAQYESCRSRTVASAGGGECVNVLILVSQAKGIL